MQTRKPGLVPGGIDLTKMFHDLCAGIISRRAATGRGGANLSSAIRVFVLNATCRSLQHPAFTRII
ncbi:MAG: hypothetical protein ACRD36_09365 [Candidatus Acidiferrum sp.]